MNAKSVSSKPSVDRKHITDEIQRLMKIMEQLRDKVDGCPWDIEQNFDSLLPSLIEEAYEVMDAVQSKNIKLIEEELGDLLMVIAFYAQIASEEELFNLNDIAKHVANKLVRRHPHIFGGGDKVHSAEQQKINWELSKKAERRTDTEGKIEESLTWSLPSLVLATKTTKHDPNAIPKKQKFDGENFKLSLQKIVKDVDQNDTIDELLGLVLYKIVKLASEHSIDPELTLRNYLTTLVKKWDDRINK